MKYQLIKEVNPHYSAIEQILTNRGIKHEEIEHYINTTDEDINSFLEFGEKVLYRAAKKLLFHIQGGKGKVVIIVDSDCDGFTSSALLINYLYKLFPAWVENNLSWTLHSGKQHGLSDFDYEKYGLGLSLVIVPDAGSNDYEYHKKLKKAGIDLIILDHHEAEKISEDAIVINNQLCDYSNKFLSGVGVTWQFCRYIDSLLGCNYADYYLDLVALGLTADMMSLKSLETKHLINKGFAPENVHNPFIYEMWQKNKFKLGDHITSWGAAFYIAPFVNAMVRSGTQDEKELLFESMLNFKAFQMISSTKRGHKGEEEKLVEQAIRTCTNVKNRQTRAQDSGMTFLESLIKEEFLLDNKVLLFLLKPGEVDRNIAGLIANKFMAKYQRPCCILTRVEENIEKETSGIISSGELGTIYLKDKKVTYQGSARGCDKIGITEFKDMCEDTGVVDWCVGHQGAFGISIPENNISEFIRITNENLKYMSEEPLYYVDYIYDGANVNAQNILDIADMGEFWGKDIDESLIAIKHLMVTKDMITLMSADKNPTLKITLPNRVSIIKFGSSQEEYEKFLLGQGTIVDIVGKCNKNEWMGNVNAQILVEDYEITDYCKYIF